MSRLVPPEVSIRSSAESNAEYRCFRTLIPAAVEGDGLPFRVLCETIRSAFVTFLNRPSCRPVTCPQETCVQSALADEPCALIQNLCRPDLKSCKQQSEDLDLEPKDENHFSKHPSCPVPPTILGQRESEITDFGNKNLLRTVIVCTKNRPKFLKEI